ncbi:hypothetical protein AYI68_g2785 [Smittium mucronatum]|uniref:Uncharacterized protein n=1 Tax=Smittium mucronatum TaxID=133383 RepID=A0A1R0H1R9_9FUNG|nr:hypothetical protein AYI68_g2785 [Smittium mucronatum]
MFQKSNSVEQSSNEPVHTEYIPEHDAISGNLEKNGDIWELLCVTLSDWQQFMDTLSKSKRKQDKELFQQFTTDFLDQIFRTIRRNERKARERSEPPAPLKKSLRIQMLAQQKSNHTL